MVPTVPRSMSDRPSRDPILKVQFNAVKRPHGVHGDYNGILIMDGKSWMPDEADGLNLKLLIVAHAGQTGHRGSDATLASLGEQFHLSWDNCRHEGLRCKLSAMHSIS